MTKHNERQLGDQYAFPTTWDQTGGLTKREYLAAKILAALVPAFPGAGPMALVGRTMALVEQILSHLASESASANRIADYQDDDEMIDLDAAGDPNLLPPF